MRFKRFIYSLLLLLFSLALMADLGLWFLVPEAETDAGAQTGFSFTPPEGGSFSFTPEGGSSPDAGGRSERSDGSGRRRSRPKSDGEAETAEAVEPSEAAEASPVRDWLSARVEELRQYLPLAELTPLKEAVAPYRLPVLIGSLLGMVLCILRLVFLGRKLRRQREEQEEGLALRRVALWPAFLLLLGALSLVIYLFPGSEEEKAQEGAVTNARILSGTVTEKTVVSLIQSAGSLAEQEAVSVTIPASVTLSAVCVHKGDAVRAGQILGKADGTSVMQAILSVHEALAAIDDQLQKAHEAKTETNLTAPVAGTVKVIYARVGDRVMDVMNEHGSLMLLSLDGRMAVRIRTDDLAVGSPVTVTLSDGTELAGETVYLEEGIATVTVADRGYAIGEQVSVKDAKGALLGSGPLYVHKALNVTGYIGTVARVYRSEGSPVYGGTPVIGISDTADLAEYQALLQQRAKYEKELKTLFELSETGYIHAPCNGVIDGLSDKIPYASLADMAAGLSVRLLAARPADAAPEEFDNFLAEVEARDGDTLYLVKGGLVEGLLSYAPLPSPSGSLEGSYVIPGSVPVYVLSGGWNTVSPDSILPGDKVLFTFDGSGSLIWVIVEHTAASATPTPTPSPTPAPTPSPTPDGSARPGAGGSQTGESPSPSGSPGRSSGRTGGTIRFRVSSGRSSSGSASAQPAYTIAEKELCTVTPQEKMLVTVPVDELDVLSLSLGQEADLYLDALPALGFTATVTGIDPEGENSGGNTKYSVTLTLDRQPQLYPGMNGTVCFPRREGRQVPTVSLAALTEDGDRTLVYTGYDPETEALLDPVEVETGLSDGTDVEIRSGLSVGDVFWYRYADAISYVTDVTE